MKLLSRVLAASAAALVLAPMSAMALPPDCDVTCVDTPSCSLVCAIPWGFRVITCEKWFNDYEVGGTCSPDAQDPSEEEEEFSSVEPRQSVMPGMASACAAQPMTASAR